MTVRTTVARSAPQDVAMGDTERAAADMSARDAMMVF